MLNVYRNEKTLAERVLGTYANHSSKAVFVKQFSKKCCLATGQMSQTTNKFLYQVSVEMSFDELESLTDAFGTMSKAPNAVNYAEISETRDSQGNSYRLVLKRSENDGLLVCKMKSSPVVDNFAVDQDDNPDPDPLPDNASQQPPPDTRTWTECFGKFYINKNDDWVKIRNSLREFCVEVNHLLNVDDASRIDVVPPTPPPSTSSTPSTSTPKPLLSQPAAEPSVQVVPPQVQRQIEGPKAKGKRLATDTMGGEKKKKKKQQIVSDEEDEVSNT
jgi:hypothetical protein